MTTTIRQAAPRWVLAVLTALMVVAALFLAAGTASAATAPAAENRVRAAASAAQALDRPPQSVSADQRLGNGLPEPGFVVATGVAANTAARACSFTGATLVLMGDGSKKPIDEVKVGDEVLASDPETGEQEARKVTHVFVHEDTVSDLALDDGTVLGTTEDHPFWSVTDGRFERSDELAAGEKVLTADGRVLAVDGLDTRTARTGLAYKLAVDGIHTHHVGDDAILVHNTCPVFGLDDAFASGQLPAKGGALSEAGRALQK